MKSSSINPTLLAIGVAVRLHAPEPPRELINMTVNQVWDNVDTVMASSQILYILLTVRPTLIEMSKNREPIPLG